jgi:hypothetical protein
LYGLILTRYRGNPVATLMGDARDRQPADRCRMDSRRDRDEKASEPVGCVPPACTRTDWRQRYAPCSGRRRSSFACVSGLRNEKVRGSSPLSSTHLESRSDLLASRWSRARTNHCLPSIDVHRSCSAPAPGRAELCRSPLPGCGRSTGGGVTHTFGREHAAPTQGGDGLA